MDTIARKSIPVAAEPASLASALREVGSVERAAVESMVGPLPANLSEAGALATLLNLANEVVKEAINAAQYQAYAAARDEEDIAFEQAVRTRRNRREKAAA